MTARNAPAQLDDAQLAAIRQRAKRSATGSVRLTDRELSALLAALEEARAEHSDVVTSLAVQRDMAIHARHLAEQERDALRAVLAPQLERPFHHNVTLPTSRFIAPECKFCGHAYPDHTDDCPTRRTAALLGRPG